MRSLLSFLLILAALASCSAQWGEHPWPPSDPDFGQSPVKRAALPAIRDLPRIASETSTAFTSGDRADVIAQSEGVTYFPPLPNKYTRYLMECDAGGSPQWVIQAVRGLKPGSATLRYTFINADTVHSLSGAVFTGIADFNLDTWSFQDVSLIGWRDGYPDDHYVALNVQPGAQPVGPDGNLYLVVIACGAWAEASCSPRLGVHWEYDAPFLAAPVLSGSIEIDPGPDWESPQCGGLAIYRCWGEWEPETAEIIDGWYDDWLPESFSDPHAGNPLCSYAAALRVSPDQATPPLSEFSNVQTFGEK